MQFDTDITNAPAQGTQLDPKTTAPEWAGGCVLLAEDDADDVFLLRRAFVQAKLKHYVIDVGDGEEAVAYLSGIAPFDDRSRYPVPDLVLLDLKMPRMDGFEVLSWLTERPSLNNLPVVVLTSSPLSADKEKAIRLGARDFHTKPGNADERGALVKSLHERWLAEGKPGTVTE